MYMYASSTVMKIKIILEFRSGVRLNDTGFNTSRGYCCNNAEVGFDFYQSYIIAF